MSRVINPNSPGKRRNQLRRTIAEILRHLMRKRELDEEAKDMAAALVFSLRGIAETIEATTGAWEKRDYFLKADRFRRKWEWVMPAAQRLEGVITNVTHFGAFIDIGVHQDALIHISQLSHTFVKDPNDVVAVGDVLRVKVLEIDIPRNRISVTRKY